jgi:hypothetical protein
MFIIEKEEEKTWAQSRKRLLTSHKIQKAADYFFAIYRVPDISFFPPPTNTHAKFEKRINSACSVKVSRGGHKHF